MVDVHTKFNGNVNVYTMDHRGTGRSTLLNCVAAQATMSGSPFGSDISVSEVPSCAKDIETKYGKDLSAFSITSAATDVSTFITKFQGSSGQTFVYGVSYGTSVVERLIHLKNPAISGYILDGISTTSGSDVKNFEYFSTWDNDFGEVGDYFMTFCAQDATCAAKFPSLSLSATLKNVISTFDTQPESKCAALVRDITSGEPGVALESASYTLRKSLGSLFQSSDTRAVIPALAYRLNRCSDVDVPVLKYYFNVSGSALSTVSEEDVFESTLLYYLIVFSEMWEAPVPSLATFTKRFTDTSICNGGTISNVPTYCAFSKEKSATCTSVNAASYAASPLVYKKDKYWNTAAEIPSGASVLLMSSKMDPQTPHKYAEYLLAAIDGNAKELVTFEHATHGTLWTTPYSDDAGAVTCGMAILLSYVKNGGDLSKLDKSCVTAMPPISFTIDEDTRNSLLATEDPFDGKFDSSLSSSTSSNSGDTSDSNSGGYKTAFIVFLVLFALAAIACFIFVLRWRKAKRENAIKVAESNPSTRLEDASSDASPSGAFQANREQA